MLKEGNLTITKEAPSDFNFDEWMTLHQTDPDAFEEKRKVAIAKLIDSAPASMQARLNGLVFKIDVERKKAKTPLQSCINISTLMWEKFDELKVNLNAICHPEKLSTEEKSQVLLPKKNESATILEFKRKE